MYCPCEYVESVIKFKFQINLPFSLSLSCLSFFSRIDRKFEFLMCRAEFDARVMCNTWRPSDPLARPTPHPDRFDFVFVSCDATPYGTRWCVTRGLFFSIIDSGKLVWWLWDCLFEKHVLWCGNNEWMKMWFGKFMVSAEYRCKYFFIEIEFWQIFWNKRIFMLLTFIYYTFEFCIFLCEINHLITLYLFCVTWHDYNLWFCIFWVFVFILIKLIVCLLIIIIVKLKLKRLSLLIFQQRS